MVAHALSGGVKPRLPILKTKDEMKELDNFFGDIMSDLDKLTIIPLLSNCCGAKPMGELFKNFGRCCECLEMAEFSKSNK